MKLIISSFAKKLEFAYEVKLCVLFRLPTILFLTKHRQVRSGYRGKWMHLPGLEP